MFCPKCGTQLHDGTQFCNSCGTPQGAQSAPPVQQYQPVQPVQPVNTGMRCSKCGGTNVIVQREQVSGKTKTRNRGRGIMWKLGRLCLICITCGLWLLVGRSKGKSNGKTKFKNSTVAVCQSCGNTWNV